MTKPQSLLDQIKNDVLDQGVPLAGALRKCVVLGGRSGSTELRDWAARELRGYEPDNADLPAYRTVTAVLQMDWGSMAYEARGQTISPSQLPDFARDKVKEQVTMYQGVGELEAMHATSLGDGHLRLSFQNASGLAAYMTSENEDGMVVRRLYHSVSPNALAGVLDTIRTTLTELVAEMRDGATDAEGVPSAETATQAVHVAVHGDRNRVRVVSDQATGSTAVEKDPPWWKRWQIVSALVVGVAGLVTAGITLGRALTG